MVDNRNSNKSNKPIVEFKHKRFVRINQNGNYLSKEELEKKEAALKRFKEADKASAAPKENLSELEIKKRAAFFGNKELLEKSSDKPNRPQYRPDQAQRYQNGQNGQNRFPPRAPFYNRKPDENKRPNEYRDRPKPAGYVDRPKPAGYVSADPNKKPFFQKKPGEFKPSRPPFSERSQTSDSRRPAFTAATKPISFESQNLKKSPIKKKPFQAAPKKKAIPTQGIKSKTKNMLGFIDHQEGVIADSRQRSLSSIKRAREKQKAVIKKVIPRIIEVFEGITTIELSNSMSVTVENVIQKLIELDMKVVKNDKLDLQTASFIVTEFGHTPRKRAEVLDKVVIDLGTESDRSTRYPIVTVIGHVDHGKTSLLDAFRKTQFTAKESGGITQGIGASQVYTQDGRFITFIDTPGHSVFTSMRARGVNITDIVLLVIASDDGIKEQTIESIQHAQAAKAFIIVVITKCDKPDAKPDKIRQMLPNYGIVVESIGGDTPEIEVSAKTNKNLNELLDLILFHAELRNLEAPRNSKAYGFVLESYLDKQKGPIANLVIKSGTLKKGDYFVSGNVHGKIKAITDWKGKQLSEAGPSYPVQIMGLSKVVNSGEELIVMDESSAKEVAEKRDQISNENQFKQSKQNNLFSIMDIWNLLSDQKANETKNFIIKADSFGSCEAIAASLSKVQIENMTIDIILKGVGSVVENDIYLAKASNATVIAFKTDVGTNAVKLAGSLGIEIRKYDIIYKILEDTEAEIKDMFAPKEEIVELGRAEIRVVFAQPKTLTVAGCFITAGIIKINSKATIFRNGVMIYSSKVQSIRQFKEDKKEVKNGQECGIVIQNFSDYKVGDVIVSSETRSISE